MKPALPLIATSRVQKAVRVDRRRLIIIMEPFGLDKQPDHGALLSVNQALVNVTSTASRRLFFYTLSDDCEYCPFRRWLDVAPTITTGAAAAAAGHQVEIIDTAYGQRWRVYDSDMGPIVQMWNTCDIYI